MPFDDRSWYDPHPDADRWREPYVDPVRDLGALERLTHLVLVDGRLVDVWTEPVRGTRWEEQADRFDREREPLAPPPPPPPPSPAHEQVTTWLRQVCGGSDAVEALDTVPLTMAGLDLPDDLPDLRSRHRLESAASLLDAVGQEWFDMGPDGEVVCALRSALLAVWQADPDAVRGSKSAAHLAGGICWAVGKANESFRTGGGLTQAQVRDALGLRGNLSGSGTGVQRALRGFGSFDHGVGLGYAGRAMGVPDLLALGHVGLLTSRTRRRLVRLRERAAEARAAAA